MGSTTSKSIHQAKKNDNMNSSKSKGKLERKKKVKQAEKGACVPSEIHFGESGESSLSDTSRNGSSSSSNFLSRFKFFPGNIGSRSSRANCGTSTSSIMSNDEHIHSSRFSRKTKIRSGCELFPSCFMPMSPGRRDDDSNSDSGSDDSDASSIHELGLNADNNDGMESNGDVFYPRNGSRYGGNRRMESREPVEQNVRFSRNLSVGRLRDRVLHRPTFPELESFPLQSEERVVSSGVDNRDNGSRMSNENVVVATPPISNSSSTVTNTVYWNHDFEVENMGVRETSYANLLEHRANFLERRRRIRSQVHALQRLGNRFENLSGHERSCISSGQHRTGHCRCRLNNQDPNDGTNARGSMSRIVLLTEALFEVLDEIRQQSVASSSQPALSSIGSVPAPIEVVEALPVKLYHKLSKHLKEDDAQCYICLAEYEDGDEVRVLSCHHEFHKSCIDKWLKEIHRICPLCRDDVCKTGSLHAEGSHL
ncbi:hypothetical protein SSX86_006183 [Deinandra increscens subsp. villosa]|uniref:RING-type domain-containing protein n=1 Tax=Deinandra increscens subsp. villosa TaxID=3103831 RepID=A0AAP0DMJ2_9ASTR